jgi:hypothetical protein
MNAKVFAVSLGLLAAATGAEEAINPLDGGLQSAGAPCPPECDPDSGPIVFGDPVVKEVLEQTLGIPNPTCLDMYLLTRLDVSGRGVKSLAGLEWALNLRELYAANNQIPDVNYLACRDSSVWCSTTTPSGTCRRCRNSLRSGTSISAAVTSAT